MLVFEVKCFSIILIRVSSMMEKLNPYLMHIMVYTCREMGIDT